MRVKYVWPGSESQWSNLRQRRSHAMLPKQYCTGSDIMPHAYNMEIVPVAIFDTCQGASAQGHVK